MAIQETYGFELESYGLDESDLGYHTHKEEIENVFVNEYGLDFIETVKGDGSLSSDGFELNCGIFEGIKDFKKALNETINVCINEDFVPKSPCALHIHIGGHQKPLNFSLLSHAFDSIYRHIITGNDSDIMWQQRHINLSRLNQPLYKSCQDTSEYRNMLDHLPISSSRGYTLRNRCNRTIEFRAIPLRINPKYINGWLKIYEGIKKRANHLSYDKCLKLVNKINEVDINNKYEILKNISGLNDYELFVLHHKINNETKGKWDQLKKLDYDYMDIVRGVKIRGPDISESDNLKNKFDRLGIHYNISTLRIFNEEVFYPHNFSTNHFRHNLTNIREVKALNTITYNELWDLLDRNGYVFRNTLPTQMLQYLRNEGLITRELY